MNSDLLSDYTILRDKKVLRFSLNFKFKIFAFLLGKKSDDPSNPDYVPSIFTFKKSKDNSNQQRLDRFQRLLNRTQPKDEQTLESYDADVLEMDDNPETGTQYFHKSLLFRFLLKLSILFLNSVRYIFFYENTQGCR